MKGNLYVRLFDFNQKIIAKPDRTSTFMKCWVQKDEDGAEGKCMYNCLL